MAGFLTPTSFLPPSRSARDFGWYKLLALRPCLSGQPSRMRLIEGLTRDLQAAANVWTSKAEEVPRYSVVQREAALDFIAVPGRGGPLS